MLMSAFRYVFNNRYDCIEFERYLDKAGYVVRPEDYRPHSNAIYLIGTEVHYLDAFNPQYMASDISKEDMLAKLLLIEL